MSSSSERPGGPGNGTGAALTRLQIAHTADLEATVLAAGRALLFDVFDDMAESDWEHCLGGRHVLVWNGTDLVGHAALIQRRIVHNGRTLRAGHVEGVAVRADHRRAGHGAAMMAELERAIRAAYDIGTLGATDEGARFYAARGWRLWSGPTSALTPTGIQRTPEDDDCVYVYPATLAFDLTGELTCDWRDGAVW